MPLSFPRTLVAGVALLGLSLAWPMSAVGYDAPDAVYTNIAHDIRAEIASGRLTGVSVALVQHGRMHFLCN